jgi:DNA invertase Pin-like site-specific DNA recombinase
MLAVMGGMAEVEREMILTRTAEGKARKKARGELREGRPPKLNAAQRQEALARPNDGETLVDVARTFNVSHSTIQRLKPKVGG